jgi:protein gp37
MKKTKIDWCDSTWNPVTGCYHNCEYCYARGIAERFGGYYLPESGLEGNHIHGMDCEPIQERELDGPIRYRTKSGKIHAAPYPFGFAPTLHRYKLNVEKEVGKEPKTVFVGSMCDLFGEWVPDAWITEVFAACAAAPQHRYLFLTKNVQRYYDLIDLKLLPDANNMWFGATADGNTDGFGTFTRNSFYSVEPLLAPIGFIISNWIIIGAESGNRKGKVVPRREWIEDIVTNAQECKVPVFMKNSLIPIVGAENMRREFPWEAGT